MYNSYNEDLKKFGSFRIEDWRKDHEEYQKVFQQYKETIPTAEDPELSFNFRSNLINSLKPFVNKRGVRDRLFSGDEHEVKVVQIEQIPGSAKLIYRDLDRCVSACEPIYIRSVETAQQDIEPSAKKLYKKAKKL